MNTRSKIPLVSIMTTLTSVGCFLGGDPLEGEWELKEEGEVCASGSYTYSYEGYTYTYDLDICLGVKDLKFTVHEGVLKEMMLNFHTPLLTHLLILDMEKHIQM